MTKPERAVSEFLRDELHVWWKYEFPIFVYDEKERPRVWTPDFFLENLNMYVEVVGSEKYWEDKERNYQYRRRIFKKNKVNVVFVHFWKPDWKEHTAQMIRRIDNSGTQKLRD